MDGVVVAIIAATPPMTGVAWAVYKELKKIGHSVNGELESKFDRVHESLGELHAEVRDTRADLRDMKADLRDHKSEHAGDGR